MNKAFFSQRFTQYMKDWQRERKSKGEKYSQYEFARQVKEAREKKTGEKCPVTDKYVSQWIHEKWVPVEYFPEIAEVLGISIESLYPSTHDEKYENESSFITEIGKDHVKFSKEIGLNVEFVKVLESLVDFDSLFPLYSPIQNSVWDPKTKQRIYNREVEHSHSAEIDQDLQYLQLNRDGKRITMHRCDLAFLKEVQDAVVDAVEFLFYKRMKEMKREVEAFNRDRIIVTKNGEVVDPSEVPDGDPVVFDSPEAFDKALEELRESLKEDGSEYKVTHKEDITREYILEHDRFAKYMRVIDPRRHEKVTKRKATQKDIDAFCEKGESNGNDQSKNK